MSKKKFKLVIKEAAAPGLAQAAHATDVQSRISQARKALDRPTASDTGHPGPGALLDKPRTDVGDITSALKTALEVPIRRSSTQRTQRTQRTALEKPNVVVVDPTKRGTPVGKDKPVPPIRPIIKEKPPPPPPPKEYEFGQGLSYSDYETDPIHDTFPVVKDGAIIGYETPEGKMLTWEGSGTVAKPCRTPACRKFSRWRRKNPRKQPPPEEKPVEPVVEPVVEPAVEPEASKPEPPFKLGKPVTKSWMGVPMPPVIMNGKIIGYVNPSGIISNPRGSATCRTSACQKYKKWKKAQEGVRENKQRSGYKVKILKEQGDLGPTPRRVVFPDNPEMWTDEPGPAPIPPVKKPLIVDPPIVDPVEPVEVPTVTKTERYIFLAGNSHMLGYAKSIIKHYKDLEKQNPSVEYKFIKTMNPIGKGGSIQKQSIKFDEALKTLPKGATVAAIIYGGTPVSTRWKKYLDNLLTKYQQHSSNITFISSPAPRKDVENDFFKKRHEHNESVNSYLQEKEIQHHNIFGDTKQTLNPKDHYYPGNHGRMHLNSSGYNIAYEKFIRKQIKLDISPEKPPEPLEIKPVGTELIKLEGANMNIRHNGRQSYGQQHVIDALKKAQKMLDSDGASLRVHNISSKKGGAPNSYCVGDRSLLDARKCKAAKHKWRGHVSHRYGTDADIAYFRKGENKPTDFTQMTPETIDLQRNLKVIDTLMDTGHLKAIFVDDRKVPRSRKMWIKEALIAQAKELGWSREKIQNLSNILRDSRSSNHGNHLHIRFVDLRRKK